MHLCYGNGALVVGGLVRWSTGERFAKVLMSLVSQCVCVCVLSGASDKNILDFFLIKRIKDSDAFGLVSGSTM